VGKTVGSGPTAYLTSVRLRICHRGRWQLVYAPELMISTIQRVLACALLATLTALTVHLCLLARAATALPGELAATVNVFLNSAWHPPARPPDQAVRRR
jgi:hypothetical protein